MAAKKYLFPFYAYSFFEGFVPVYPVYMIMFSQRGYSFTELSILMLIWAAPVAVLELPSGILADRWSRKGLVVLGAAFKVLCFLLWALSPSFAAAAAGFVLWGIQEAFASGAQQALLYENLRDHGHEGNYEAAAGACRVAETAGLAGAMLIGGPLYTLGAALPAALSVPAALSAAAAALGMRERRTGSTAPRAAGELLDSASLRSTFGIAWTLRILLAVSFIAGGAYGLVDEYDGLWAVEGFGVPVALVGVWLALRFAAESLGAAAAGRLAPLAERAGGVGIAGALALSGSAFMLSTVLPRPAGIALYLFYYLSMAAVTVLIEGRIQRAAEDSGRATLLSFSSLGVTLAAAAYAPFFGLAADAHGFAWIIRISGAASLAAAAVWLGFPRRPGNTASARPPARPSP